MNTRAWKASLATLTVLASAPMVLAQADGALSLFNGRNLDGWEGNPALWSVQDGAITGQTKADTNLKHNTFLVWKGGTVDDFELQFRYRIVNGNSGLQYRSRVVEQGAQGPIVAGYQADFEAGKTYTRREVASETCGCVGWSARRTSIARNDAGVARSSPGAMPCTIGPKRRPISADARRPSGAANRSRSGRWSTTGSRDVDARTEGATKPRTGRR